MSEPIRTTDDEIDLIELIKMLWGGKWLITGLCMIGLIMAGNRTGNIRFIRQIEFNRRKKWFYLPKRRR